MFEWPAVDRDDIVERVTIRRARGVRVLPDIAGFYAGALAPARRSTSGVHAHSATTPADQAGRIMAAR
jgi:hypothetical protein